MMESTVRLAWSRYQRLVREHAPVDAVEKARRRFMLIFDRWLMQ